MLRADLLDCVNEFLRKHGPRPGEPFGGVRMVFVGDLYQLPPVVPPDAGHIFKGGRYETPYFFSADALSSEQPEPVKLELVELKKVYRQEDIAFIDLLDRIRTESVDHGDLPRLNQRVGPGRASAICLTTTNEAADRVNASKLAPLDGEPAISRGKTQGEFSDGSTRSARDSAARRTSEYPAPETLTFKVGARVMLLNNDPAGRWVNGSIGELVEIVEPSQRVRVRLEEREEPVDVERFTWSRVRHTLKNGTITTEEIGSFRQLPFRLAWAVTIHKSQGQTFKNIVIDLGGGAFVAGQTYVALSRSTSLEGIALRRPIDRRSIFADSRIEKFLAACRDRST